MRILIFLIILIAIAKGSVKKNDFVYCDKKAIDYTEEECRDIATKHKALIVDFDATTTNIFYLEKHGVKTYYRLQLYEGYRLDDIADHVQKAKELGCTGVALDLEAYSGSRIWQDPFYDVFHARSISRIIKNYGFDEVVIYPEYLGGDKYDKYLEFVSGLEDIKLHILMERTYNVWEPWNLVFYYVRALKDLRKTNTNFSLYIGIWPESLNPVCRVIQHLSTITYPRFYYSETKNVN